MKSTTEKQFLDYSRDKLREMETFPPGYFTAGNICDQLDYYPHSRYLCLGCVEEYEEGMEFPKTGQLYTLVGTRVNREVVKEKLKNKICALLNGGGGYLFLTDQQKPKITGGNWLPNCIHMWQSFIKSVQQSIFPSAYSLSLTQIPVKSKSKNQKPEKEKEKCMIRVTVVPDSKRYTYFVMKKFQKYRAAVSCYFVDQGDWNQVGDVDNCGYFYSIMLAKYAKDREATRKMAQGYPIKFTKNPTKKCIQRLSPQDTLTIPVPNPQNGTPTLTKIQKILKKVQQQQPTTFYKHQSLLLLSSESDDGLIELLKARLIANKMPLCFFMKPYTNYRGHSPKSIWFIAHDYLLDSVKGVLDGLLKEYQGQFKVLATITVTKFISVQNKTQSTLQQLFLIYNQLFKKALKPVKIISSKQQQTYNFYFKFQTFQESIFLFIFLENIGIRSMFCKESLYNSKEEYFKEVNHGMGNQGYQGNQGNQGY